MIRGIYLSAQGADVQTRRLDVVANNLANASTTGFKRDLALIQSHPPLAKINGKHSDPDAVKNAIGGTTLAGIATDHRDGSLTDTGNSLDLALRGPGFFRVSNGSQQFLTRAGNFSMTAQGDVVTQSHGLNLQTSSGNSLNIPANIGKIVVDEEGRVTGLTQGTLDPIPLGKLDVVRPVSFENLQKHGEGLYLDDGSAESAGNAVSVQQGFLEASGTRPMLEMIEMIETSRVLEMNVNSIKLQDESLGRLLQAMPNR
ncbi:MAG: flagellar hook-basal body protein [Planctomycetota bacterium]|nr:flagellar hook-basal body protein [Planctomycetota bacterium]